MPRCELVSGDWRKFWEYELAGRAVMVRHGRRGTKGQATTTRFASTAEARHAYDALIAEKLADGRYSPAHPGKRDPGGGTRARSRGIRPLEDVARKTPRIQIAFTLGSERGAVRAALDLRKPAWGNFPPVVEMNVSSAGPHIVSNRSRAMGLAGPLEDLRRRYPHAALVPDQLSITSRGCPLSPRALRPLVTRVLTDLFASESPAAAAAAAEVAAEAAAKRARVRVEVVEQAGTTARAPNVWPDANIKTELSVARLKFTPDGRHLLIGLVPEVMQDGPAAIEIWAPDGTRPAREIRMPGGSGRYTKCLAISPDGKWCVSGSRTLRIYALPTGRLAGYLKGHTGARADVYDVRFSPDGRTVASGSSDGTARLWSFKSRKEIGRFAHKDWVGSVAFTPTGQRLITGCLSSTNLPTSFGGLQSFDHDGSNEVRYALPYAAMPYWTEVAVSPDGRFLVAANGAGKRSDAAGVWNLKTGRFLRTLPGRRISAVVDAAFTSNGDWLVTSHYNGLCIWSTKTWKLASTIAGERRMALSADDRFIAYQNGNEVRVRKFERPGRARAKD